MGRLSDYINSGGRSSSTYSGGSTSRNGDVEVIGFDEVLEKFERMLMSNYDNEVRVRSMIRKVLREARGKISQDIRSNLHEDPRKAYKAVKTSVYKRTLGGNISILQKRGGTAGAESTYQRPRTLRRGQRGGNRIQRVSDSRNRLDKYQGADRGFVLRFINSGTVERRGRYGSRGAIASRGIFAHTAPWTLQAAAEKLSSMIDELIKETING